MRVDPKAQSNIASIMKMLQILLYVLSYASAIAYLLLMHSLNIDIDQNCIAYYKCRNRKRIATIEIWTQNATREGWISRRHQWSSSHEFAIVKLLYIVFKLMTKYKVKNSLLNSNKTIFKALNAIFFKRCFRNRWNMISEKSLDESFSNLHKIHKDKKNLGIVEDFFLSWFLKNFYCM